MESTILIVGAGQLGSRYLQGLADCQNTLDIYVKDISEQSLKVAKQRWEQLVHTVAPNTLSGKTKPAAQHKVTFLSSFEKIPKQVDIAIIATNADVRALVVKQIVKKCDVRYWIFEKVLAQSEGELEDITTLSRNSVGAWVNTSRRMMEWQKQICNSLPTCVPLFATIKGHSWGLACNGIHFLDLVAWWTGETLTTIDTSELDLKWTESKRKGFFEITGGITAKFSKGSILTMESVLDEKATTFSIESQGEVWYIDEKSGVASGPEGVIIKGKNEMQSSMTTRLVDSLLKEGTCDLPRLLESTELHRVFIISLLKHWNYSHNTKIVKLPIT